MVVACIGYERLSILDAHRETNADDRSASCPVNALPLQRALAGARTFGVELLPERGELGMGMLRELDHDSADVLRMPRKKI